MKQHFHLFFIAIFLLLYSGCKENSTDPGNVNQDVTLFSQSGIDSVIGSGSIHSTIQVPDIMYNENDSLVLSYDIKRVGSLRRKAFVEYEDPAHNTGEFFPLNSDSTTSDYKSFSVGKKITSYQAGHKLLRCIFYANNDFKAWIKNFKIIKKG